MYILYILENVAALSAVHCDVFFLLFFYQANQVIHSKLPRLSNQIKMECCRNMQGFCLLQTQLSMQHRIISTTI